MRTFLATHWKSIAALIILVLLALIVLPTGSASPALAARLQARADAMARHTTGASGLDDAARYIATALATEGYRVQSQRDGTGLQAVRKIEAWRSGARLGRQPLRSFVLAARYGSPDDDQVASTAAMLELARLLKTVRPAAGTEIRFVFFVSRAVPADAPFGSFIAYAGPRTGLGRVSETLALFRDPPENIAGALAAPAWVQGVTVGHLTPGADSGAGAMLLADIGALHSPCLRATGDNNQPRYKPIARMLEQLAQTIRALGGVTDS